MQEESKPTCWSRKFYPELFWQKLCFASFNLCNDWLALNCCEWHFLGFLTNFSAQFSSWNRLQTNSFLGNSSSRIVDRVVWLLSFIASRRRWIWCWGCWPCNHIPPHTVGCLVTRYVRTPPGQGVPVTSPVQGELLVLACPSSTPFDWFSCACGRSIRHNKNHRAKSLYVHAFNKEIQTDTNRYAHPSTVHMCTY